jgi:hypothetical protein
VQLSVKHFLTRIGARCSRETIRQLDATLNYLEVGRWLREKGLAVPSRVAAREAVFDAAVSAIRDKQVLYLEFGVWQGVSMRYWSNALHNPASRLSGFDSFEGLPEAWNQNYRKGHFSTGGQIPQIDDPRVQFFKGWFEETLPKYLPPEHEQLVINLDADLYSSTIFVLNSLRSHIKVGTYLYFDEFFDRNNELRAFDEFLAKTAMRFELLAASRLLREVMFRRVE